MQYSIVNTDYELQLCLDLRRKVFVIEQGITVDLEIDQYDAAPHECVHGLIIAEDGEAAATGRLIPYGENSCKLQRIAVREELRGSGVGREILRTAGGCWSFFPMCFWTLNAVQKHYMLTRAI